ncbi:hypothetical protein SAMN05661012_00354 [Chitinophaga sancti]|uniref:Uncharacterized protein n=1 Tax=Chitinophaga sancti TaxID=1004 RepID=A0A1K1M0M0_9BACT|nr:hypothetical protein SAMN05661012_00354 [Chitinophaga sancti]
MDEKPVSFPAPALSEVVKILGVAMVFVLAQLAERLAGNEA